MGFCSCTTKYMLFLFNIICAIAGIGVIVTGVLTNSHGSSLKKVLAGEVTTTSIVLMVLGATIFIIAFFGCCGAIREDTCMITTYGVILLVILLIEVAIGGVAFYYKGQVGKELKLQFEKEFDTYDDNSKTFIDTIQKEFKCCGIHGSSDWGHNQQALRSCCQVDVPNGGKCPPSNLNTRGCEDIVVDTIQNLLKVIGAVAIGIAVIELLGVVCALCLASSIRRAERRGYA